MWLEPTKNGKFKAAERYIDPMTGKTRRVTTIIDKDTKACRKAAETVLRSKIEEAMRIKKDDEITLQELSEKYLASLKDDINITTYRSYKSYINNIVDILGKDVLANNLTARYVDEKFSQSGKGKITLVAYTKHFRMLITWGYRLDYMEDISFLRRLTKYEDKEKKSRIEDKYLSSDELKKLIRHMKDIRWRLLTQFLALSGLRIGEAMALDDADVTDYIIVNKTTDISNGEVYAGAKTSAGNREVYIQPELKKVIEQIRKFRGNDVIIFLPGADGCRFQYNAYRRFLAKETSKVVGRRLTPHALRHTHVSLLAEQGYPLEAISRRVGHEDSKITKEIYLHVTERQKEKDNQMMKQIRLLI